MKSLCILLVSLLMGASLMAQTVTIKLNDKRNKEVRIDGKTYSITDMDNRNNATITVTGLVPGQHSLEVIRSGNKWENVTRNFYLRDDYDLQISVDRDGSIALRESASTNTGNVNIHNKGRIAMPESEFEKLYEKARGHFRASSVYREVYNALANTSNYFSTAQATRLIELVSSQKDRLELSKMAYRTVTDPQNFTSINSLLNTQAGRNALAAHVRSYNITHYGNEYAYENGSATGMSTANFNALLRSVRNARGQAAKMTTLSNIFGNNAYDFTTAQAKRLIQQVNSESNRLELAKLAYDNVTDPANYGQMYGLLNSQRSRDELSTYERGYASNPGYFENTAMSAADYDIIYNNVNSRWGFFQMPALVDVFDNEAYYFTTAQAKKLIILVSSEGNRMQLAKASYDNIVDRDNFSDLYDIFNEQSNMDELDEWVKEYNRNNK